MEPIWQWGIDLILTLQGFDNWLTPMRIMTVTGNTEFFLLILPALYWLVNRRIGVRVATILLVSIALGSILKIAGHSPRPYWIDPRVQLLGGAESSFGIPSLHALNAVVMWGILAQTINRWWSWLIACLLMLLAGTARVYLGVHFPSDVLAGWLLGLLLLWLWARWATPAGEWFSRRPPNQQLLLAAITSIAVILLGVLARVLAVTLWNPAVGWAAPLVQEPERLLAAFSLGDLITAAGVFVGMVAGLLFCDRLGLRLQPVNPLQQIGRYVLGVVGVLLLWQGLDLLFAQFAADESTLGYTLRYLRYAIVGFWIFGGAPLLFVQLRLAQRPAIT
jgi:membrane-associated phospholipid phosphatase